MEVIEKGRIYTEQLNVRLRPSEKQAFESEARTQGKTIAEWGREALIEALQISPAERRSMLVTIIASERTRLTLVALQDQQDISADEIQQQIEREAKAMAEATLDRWLSQKGAA